MANWFVMRVLLQRVSRAEVRIRPEVPEDTPRVSGAIHGGFLLLVGFTQSDTATEVQWMVDKVTTLRLFPDGEGKLNQDITESGGSLLVVSQFTLYADARKGRRPSFLDAARPEQAVPLYNQFVMLLRDKGYQVETGEFGAMMDVELVNDGPVTLWLERESERSTLE